MSTLLGGLLNQVQRERKLARDKAVAELWKRNKLNPNAPGYKLAETAMVQQDGTEVVEYRLYKLIDGSVVTTSAEVTTQIEQGVGTLRESRGAEGL